MKRILPIYVILILIIILVGTAGCDGITSPPSGSLSGGAGGQQASGIWVSGTGEVTVTPDIAVLQVGVEAQEPTVAEAQAKAAEAMDRVMASLENSGIDAKDIQTRYYRINQRTRWDSFNDEEVITGYQVSNTVTVKIRDIDKAGSIIDSTVAAGGDLIRINSFSFIVEDPTIYYDEAREKATADAKAKAEKLARQTGVKLGEPTYIAESSYTPAVYGGAMSGLDIPVPAPVITVETATSPGEVDITLTVQIAYSIQ